MATIIRMIDLAADAADVWGRLSDFAGPQEKTFPGVVSHTTFNDGIRTITFANGMSVKERITGVNEQARRIAYGSVESRSEHHNASFQVLAGDGGQGCRVVWTTDILPDTLAPMVKTNMENGLQALSTVFGQANVSKTNRGLKIGG